MHPDFEHELAIATHHQRWVVRYAWLFTLTTLLAFTVQPWLFASAGLFALLVRDKREARNRALDRRRAIERKHGRGE